MNRTEWTVSKIVFYWQVCCGIQRKDLKQVWDILFFLLTLGLISLAGRDTVRRHRCLCVWRGCPTRRNLLYEFGDGLVRTIGRNWSSSNHWWGQIYDYACESGVYIFSLWIDSRLSTNRTPGACWTFVFPPSSPLFFLVISGLLYWPFFFVFLLGYCCLQTGFVYQ